MVFRNRELRRIFGPKREAREEMTLMKSFIYVCSRNIIRDIKSRKMRWAGKVAHMGEMKMNSKFWSENLKGRDHSEDLGMDGKIILEWILGKQGDKLWTRCISFSRRTLLHGVSY
jgi:hypothetical protein